MDENPLAENISDEFYGNYCAFVEEGAQECATLFEDADVRAQIIALRKPMSKTDLSLALSRMLPEHHTRFVRRMNMGYQLAKLTEVSGGIIKHVRRSVERQGDTLDVDE